MTACTATIAGQLNATHSSDLGAVHRVDAWAAQGPAVHDVARKAANLQDTSKTAAAAFALLCAVAQASPGLGQHAWFAADTAGTACRMPAHDRDWQADSYLWWMPPLDAALSPHASEVQMLQDVLLEVAQELPLRQSMARQGQAVAAELQAAASSWDAATSEEAVPCEGGYLPAGNPHIVALQAVAGAPDSSDSPELASAWHPVINHALAALAKDRPELADFTREDGPAAAVVAGADLARVDSMMASQRMSASDMAVQAEELLQAAVYEAEEHKFDWRMLCNSAVHERETHAALVERLRAALRIGAHRHVADLHDSSAQAAAQRISEALDEGHVLTADLCRQAAPQALDAGPGAALQAAQSVLGAAWDAADSQDLAAALLPPLLPRMSSTASTPKASAARRILQSARSSAASRSKRLDQLRSEVQADVDSSAGTSQSLAAVSAHAAVQARLVDELSELAASLKQRAQASSEAVRKDLATLDDMEHIAEQSLTGVQASRELLALHAAGSTFTLASTCALMVGVTFAFVATYLLIRFVPAV